MYPSYWPGRWGGYTWFRHSTLWTLSSASSDESSQRAQLESCTMSFKGSVWANSKLVWKSSEHPSSPWAGRGVEVMAPEGHWAEIHPRPDHQWSKELGASFRLRPSAGLPRRELFLFLLVLGIFVLGADRILEGCIWVIVRPWPGSGAGRVCWATVSDPVPERGMLTPVRGPEV